MKRKMTRVLAVLIAIILVSTNTSLVTYASTAKNKKKVNVSSVTITKPTDNTLVLKKGKTYTLKVSVAPKNATNKELEFISGNPKVASITTKGKIKALKNGTTTITVKSKDSSKMKETLTVKVGVPVTKIKLDKSKVTVNAEDKVQLMATISPSNATVKDLKWTSSDETIASVDSNGLVTTKIDGKVQITATATDGSNIKISCSITVLPIKPTAITLNSTSQTLKVKESFTLQADILPVNAKDKTVTWSSDNDAVATVDSTGKVTAKSEGTAMISATANGDNTIKATCQVIIISQTVVVPGGNEPGGNEPGENNPGGNQPGGSEPGGNNPGGGNPGGNPIDDYKLVWSDDFTGESLDMTNWNMELHEPGWVNNELQEYTNSSDNIYVNDGKLVIKANKTVSGSAISYTSGKVTTQHKQIFKYGKFEIKAKVPTGQGLWPAIWMMPENENLYGQWPKCGEIDIMEVLGHETNKLYGTIHYGNPHASSQGTYVMSNGTLADDYHVYSVEWEPSRMRFYIDGILYHTVNDWFTKVEGGEEITYPAPFDQPFYLQLNLAVGGSWPGNPDETTNFDNAKFEVDYVKVYQKESYDENVVKPVVNLRDPDATGNYIINGNFDVAEDLLDNNDWSLLTALGGEATASISQNKLNIDTTNYGTVNYSIQLVQPRLPMKQGGNYRLTFDAKASADRKMIVNVTAPDKEYIRYMPDTEVSLTTNTQSYSFDFSMTGKDDANGRLEYNLGNQGSLAQVEISNVKLVKLSDTVIDDTKTILPDGNHVYNGAFQEGVNRMAFWEVDNKVSGASISVTNSFNIRELKVEVPNTVASMNDVIVKQTRLAITENKDYVLTFDAYGDEAKTIQTKINGQTFDSNLLTSVQSYRYQFSTGATVTSHDLEFLLGVAGITYIDNVKITEAGMILNGDFSNGFTGWQVYVDSGISSKVTYVIDSLTENSAAGFTIDDTSDAEYKIQLMQKNVELQQGKWYKLTFNAKSDMARKLMVALQRDGNADNDWTSYSGGKIADLGSDYTTYEYVFNMRNTTDPKTILSFNLGAINGTQITSTHRVWIDNVKLEETTEPVIIINPSDDLIKNGDFSQGQDNWIAAISSPGEAVYSFANNKVEFDITNLGNQDWNVQLKQSGLKFEQGKTYQVKLKVTSSVTRAIKLAYMSTSYDWYGGADVQLIAGETKEIDLTFTMNKPTDIAADFVCSMGYIQDVAVDPGIIAIENVSIKDVTN
jgi:beta-glucanase (GH16 family)/uncharacterized protein YjdB